MCDLPENIQHFHIGWKILFSFFAQDDLLYLLKMNVFLSSTGVKHSLSKEYVNFT